MKCQSLFSPLRWYAWNVKSLFSGKDKHEFIVFWICLEGDKGLEGSFIIKTSRFFTFLSGLFLHVLMPEFVKMYNYDSSAVDMNNALT